MFLAGPDGKTPELRPPSIKGAMRFWWRASEPHKKIEELKSKEEKIFGGPSCRSAFSISIENQNTSLYPMNAVLGKNDADKDILKYMTFGLNQPPGLRNAAIAPSGTFELCLTVLRTKYTKDIFRALKLLAKYGGLGAKSRNGFGSLHLETQDPQYNKLNVNDFIRKNLLGREQLTFPAFSKLTFPQESSNLVNDQKQILLSKTGRKKYWRDALVEIQSQYKSIKRAINENLGTKEKNYIAAHKPGLINVARKPKFCFLNVQLRNEKYYGQILGLPYLLANEEAAHSETLTEFSKKIANE